MSLLFVLGHVLLGEVMDERDIIFQRNQIQFFLRTEYNFSEEPNKTHGKLDDFTSKYLRDSTQIFDEN